LCAAGLLAVAVLKWRASRSLPAASEERRVALASVAVPAALVGVVVCMGLTARGYVDGITAILAKSGGKLDAGYGWGLWLSAAAAAVAVVAAYQALRTADMDVNRSVV
jgi:hypothetical protein